MKDSTDIQKQYAAYTQKKYIYLVCIALLIVFLLLLGLTLGPSNIRFSDIIPILRGHGTETQEQILFTIRLPRLLAALLSGLALAVSGVVMQSVLRNPLGSPFTLGISNAAAFGAAFAVVFWGAGKTEALAQPLTIAASAFLWSLIASFFILLVARQRGASPENMVLTGIITSSLFTALTSGLQFVADDVKLAAIVFWSFGDLAKGGWNELAIQAALILPVLLYFLRQAPQYNALDFGDETAHSLGINVPRFRRISMVGAALMTAAIVSFYGIIAFVGLVVPHIVRRTIGGDERYLLPATALTGAAFLLACDIIARTVFSPVVVPVGILTSLVGAPLFIFLLIKSKGFGQWHS